MITVRYQDNGARRRITVEGHAGYGKKGEDIMCAAASTLIMTLQRTLTDRQLKYEQRIRDGYAEIKCGDKHSRGIYYFTMRGFLELAEMYPEYFVVVSNQ